MGRDNFGEMERDGDNRCNNFGEMERNGDAIISVRWNAMGGQ